jgi:hypothetical protein
MRVIPLGKGGGIKMGIKMEIKKIALLFLIGLFGMPSLAASFTALSKEQLCANLLQTEKADLALPLNFSVITSVLKELYPQLRLLSKTNTPLPLLDLKVQHFIRTVRQALIDQPSYELRKLGVSLASFELKTTARLQLNRREEIPAQLASHIEGHLNFELKKIPDALLNLALKTNRTLFITMGPITEAPQMAHLKGVVPRGWDSPWDVIPGSGGGRFGAIVNVESLITGHGSVNLVLHEVLHSIDEACKDLANRSFSEEPEFLRLWRETSYLPDDSYMQNYPKEAFAEFGAWYFNSIETRKMLREIYSEWYVYFRDLRACTSSL